MSCFSFVRRCCLIAVALLAVRMVLAQQPAGDAPKEEVDPFGTGAKVAEKGKAEGKALEVPKAEPLAVQLLRDSNPKSPLELMRAAQAALQFGRPDECKRYLTQFLAAQASDEVLLGLPAKFGDFLVRVARHKDVQPEGGQLAEMIASAVQRAAQNAERINGLIGQLSNKDSAERAKAVAGLAECGPQIVTPMLRAIGDASRAAETPYIQAGLVRLASITEAPLVGALDATDDALKRRVIEVLGHMRSRLARGHLIRWALAADVSPETRKEAHAALVRMVGAVPDANEGRQYLAREVDRLLRGEMPYQADHDDLVELWSWDEAQHAVSPRKATRADATMYLAAQAARNLFLVSKDNSAERLMLLTGLEHAKSAAGLDRPLPMEAGSAGAAAAQAKPAIVSQVLGDALQQGRVAAAIAAAEVLGQQGDGTVLRSSGGQPSPLGEALTFSDRRVRLAAALAALQLAGSEPFSGAGRISGALAWFARSNGTPAALVAHWRSEEAGILAGFVHGLGYEGITARRGRDVFQQAIENPDVELVLISDTIDSPPVEDLVQWLRRDYRTARLPIGVIARGERLTPLRELLASDEYTRVFPWLGSQADVASEVERLKALTGRNLVGASERLDQALVALATLGELAQDPERLARFEVPRQEPAVQRALYNPRLSAAAAQVLGSLGTPTAQQALVDFASQSEQQLEHRKAAAAAFAEAVKSRGILLTTQQIAVQFDRYNASEKLDKESQEVLAAILDAIEKQSVVSGP